MGFVAVCGEYDGIYYSVCGIWLDSSQCVGNMMGFITVCLECGWIRRSVWGI